MRKTLTDSAIKALQPGGVINDAVVTGLHVRCSSAGAKSFYLFYRTKLKDSRRPKLGDCDILSIAAARELARTMLAEVAAGNDPIADRDRMAHEATLQEFWDQEVWPNHYSRTKDSRNVRRLFDVRIAPRLGNKRVRDIQYADVAGLHRHLETSPYEANRTLAVISKVLNMAERPTAAGGRALRDIGSNPCGLVARYPELSRRRFAKPVELAAIGAAMDKEWARTPASVCFIGLMVFTGMRPGEVATARRAWLERLPNGAGILRLPDSKTGQRDVYMSPQAVGLIDRLPAPTDGTLCGIQYPRKTWDNIRRAIGAPDLRLYDLRRTFATVSRAGGASMNLIGGLLGHKTTQTTMVYARLMDDAAMDIAAMTGNRMQGLLGQ
jgi:integrase